MWVPKDDSLDDWLRVASIRAVRSRWAIGIGPLPDDWNMSPRMRAALVEEAALYACDHPDRVTEKELDWAMAALERPLADTMPLEWP